ncbi:Ger(x)C family spore germination protein [Lederbergia wuyishanensis]|uniref:Spore germination protein KC n=1 Tax=Lederbergia wuyishanensis TaxID=1347903 RepID=A0ABU0D603_9BACI|nr:Ger(x)C family spore germination protein [Lederbergia wuyishanensis]MCJ8008407.1 Ger(x)C family spore germination protein [Lederbergia wuyishanensis]MDQ0343824.1 spore germination protein KC [Lederbergia wuyishanensis]
MKKMSAICMVLLISFLFLSGCWDRKELNDRAIWLSTGWDLAEDGEVEISGQIIIPGNLQMQQGGGGTTPSFFTISAKGKNVLDAQQNLQTKLPREAFLGQRRVIFFGEKFAKHGVRKKMDVNQRTPEVSLRADLFVVKGGTAKEILTLSNPLERIPASAALKEHRENGGRGDTAYLNFLIAANKKGFRPSIPTIEMSDSIEGKSGGQKDSPNQKLVRLAGVSVFDRNLKMLGYLNNEENRDLLWIMGILKKRTITISEKKGNASINLTKIKCNIKPNYSKVNQIRFIVNLEGEGQVLESNYAYNLKEKKYNRLLEKKFEKEIQDQVEQTIKKVQREYGMDIFGFGEVIHRKDPIKWKSLKNKWDQIFPTTNISVEANIKIKRIGSEGPSVINKESESKR